MSRDHGGVLTDLEHLRQSIIDILTTPKGSRVMLRSYGSDLFRLIDKPINQRLVLDMYSSIAEALYRWEPRFRLTDIKLDLTEVGEGVVHLSVSGYYYPDGQVARLQGLKLVF